MDWLSYSRLSQHTFLFLNLLLSQTPENGACAQHQEGDRDGHKERSNPDAREKYLHETIQTSDNRYVMPENNVWVSRGKSEVGLWGVSEVGW